MENPEYKIDRGEIIWERIYVRDNGEYLLSVRGCRGWCHG